MNKNPELIVKKKDSLIEDLLNRSEELGKHILEQTGSQMGSNEGGWYKDTETETSYYVKFYRNADQARVEFIANAIYRKIGIKAPESILFQKSGKTAIASVKIPDTRRADAAELSASKEVLGGFVADAYLANWDVVGLVLDNIEINKDGYYRIDNGGVLNFRARGESKNFPATSIGELKTMRDPRMAQQASKIFGKLTDSDLTEQAKQLVNKLTDEFITEVVTSSGVTNKDELVKSLIGRKKVLKETYSL